MAGGEGEGGGGGETDPASSISASVNRLGDSIRFEPDSLIVDCFYCVSKRRWGLEFTGVEG